MNERAPITGAPSETRVTPDSESATDLTLERFAETWLPERPHYYEGILRAQVFPSLGSRNLVDLRREDLNGLRSALRAQGKAEGTIRNALMVVKNLHDDAVLAGRIPPDPTGRWRSKRPLAEKAKQQEAAESLYLGEMKSAIIVAGELGISEHTVRMDLDHLGIARRPRAKGPTPEARSCSADDLCLHRGADGPRVFTPRWPSWDDRNYCSPECARAAGSAGYATAMKSALEQKEESKLTGLLDLADLSGRLGVGEAQVRLRIGEIDDGPEKLRPARFAAAGVDGLPTKVRIPLFDEVEVERFRRDVVPAIWPDARKRAHWGYMTFIKGRRVVSGEVRQRWGRQWGALQGGAPSLAERMDDQERRQAIAIARNAVERLRANPKLRLAVIVRLAIHAYGDKSVAKLKAGDSAYKTERERMVRRLRAGCELLDNPPLLTDLVAPKGEGSRVSSKGSCVTLNRRKPC